VRSAERGHVVLLGDSVFDNGAYVPGHPDVVAQLREELPPGWAADLLAVDGDVTTGVARQLRRLPRDATHLVVSVGGNDALGYAYLLQAPASSVAEGVDILGQARDRFAADYAAMLDAVVGTGLPTTVCTIYDTRLTDPSPRVVRTALTLFNDCITRAAFARGAELVDLRLVCDDDADYANPIEPSVAGGRKIARAVAAALDVDRPARRASVVAQGPLDRIGRTERLTRPPRCR
jgi:GDSL-like Lipase/Acylhydrolase family